MQALLIIGGSILAAITHGVVHDQVTARVCVEYFTVGHPPVFGTTSPTLLGLGWGIIATWWVGLILGIVLATAAQTLAAMPSSNTSTAGPGDNRRPENRRFRWIRKRKN